MILLNFKSKFKYYFKKILTHFFDYKSNNNICLIYHSIYSNNKILINDIHTVRENEFIKQINYLNQNYKIVKYDKVNHYPKKKEIVISFDDGYKDTFLTAYPLLKKKNIPFIIFVTIKNILSNNTKYMNINDLKQIATDDLVSIGSHGYNHINLKNLNNDELELELLNSKQFLEENLNITINSLSFPNGIFDDVAINFAKQVGYKNLYSSIPISNNINNFRSNIYNRKTVIYYDNIKLFKRKVLFDNNLINLKYAKF